jgi:hypothetical protein
MIAHESNAQPRLVNLVKDARQHYDAKFDTLAKSIDTQTEAIKLLSSAINHQTDAMIDFKQHWGKAIPIKLVYFIIAVIVAGQTALTALKYFLPLP